MRVPGIRDPGSRVQAVARGAGSGFPLWSFCPAVTALARPERTGAGRVCGLRASRHTDRQAGPQARGAAARGCEVSPALAAVAAGGRSGPAAANASPCVLCPQAGSQVPPRMDIRPNHTIYINNINDKIKKEGTGGCRSPLELGGCPVRPGHALARGSCLTAGLPGL